MTKGREGKGREDGDQLGFGVLILIATQWSLPIQLSRGPEGPSRWPKAIGANGFNF